MKTSDEFVSRSEKLNIKGADIDLRIVEGQEETAYLDHMHKKKLFHCELCHIQNSNQNDFNKHLAHWNHKKTAKLFEKQKNQVYVNGKRFANQNDLDKHLARKKQKMELKNERREKAMKNELPKGATLFIEGFKHNLSEGDIRKALMETFCVGEKAFATDIEKGNRSKYNEKLCQPVPGHPELTSNKMAQIWNNLKLNNAKSIADVRASALEWYRQNLQN